MDPSACREELRKLEFEKEVLEDQIAGFSEMLSTAAGSMERQQLQTSIARVQGTLALCLGRRVRVTRELESLIAAVSTTAAASSPAAAAATGRKAPEQPKNRGLLNLLGKMGATRRVGGVVVGVTGPEVVEDKTVRFGGICHHCGEDKGNAGGVAAHLKHGCEKEEETHDVREQKSKEMQALSEKAREVRVAAFAKDKLSGQPELAGVAGQSEVVRVSDQPAASLLVPLSRKRLRMPKNYTADFKLRVIEAVANYGKGGQTEMSTITDIDQSTISRWVKDKAKINLAAIKNAGMKGRGNVGRVLFRSARNRKGKFAAAEELVMTKFEAARIKRCVLRCFFAASSLELTQHKVVG